MIGRRRPPDPVTQEIAEQRARSRQILDRVERVLQSVAELVPLVKADAAAIDDYMRAEGERTRR